MRALPVEVHGWRSSTHTLQQPGVCVLIRDATLSPRPFRHREAALGGVPCAVVAAHGDRAGLWLHLDDPALRHIECGDGRAGRIRSAFADESGFHIGVRVEWRGQGGAYGDPRQVRYLGHDIVAQSARSGSCDDILYIDPALVAFGRSATLEIGRLVEETGEGR